MTDPRARLERTFPGERLHRPRALEARLTARDREREPRVRPGVTLRPPPPGPVPARRRAAVGPHVPQLIRLIRRRIPLSVRRPRPLALPERGMPERPVLRGGGFGGLARRARAELPEPRLPRPTDLHPPLGRPVPVELIRARIAAEEDAR